MNQRIPRPQGLTFLSLSLQKQEKELTEESQTKLKIHVVRQYVLNNFKLNNKHLTIDQLAKVLNLSSFLIIKEIQKLTNFFMGVGEGNDLISQARDLKILTQKWALDGHLTVMRQVALLAEAQGDRYVPYLTKELNSAMTNMLSSIRGLTALSQAMDGPGKVQNNNLFMAPGAQQKGAQSDNFLTVSEAISQLESHHPSGTLSDQDLKAQLFLENGIEGTPEVKAEHQMVPNKDGTIILKKVSGHEDRREAEYIDIDE